MELKVDLTNKRTKPSHEVNYNFFEIEMSICKLINC